MGEREPLTYPRYSEMVCGRYTNVIRSPFDCQSGRCYNDWTLPFLLERGKMADIEKAKEGTVISQRPFEKFISYLQDRGVEEQAEISLSDDLSSDQMDAILQATSEEELLHAMQFLGLTGLRDLDNGTELTLYGWKFVLSNRPDISKRVGGYAVIDAAYTNTGEGVMLDTSVERVLACLRMFEFLNAFPKEVKVFKKTTGSGNEMITLTWSLGKNAKA